MLRSKTKTETREPPERATRSRRDAPQRQSLRRSLPGESRPIRANLGSNLSPSCQEVLADKQAISARKTQLECRKIEQAMPQKESTGRPREPGVIGADPEQNRDERAAGTCHSLAQRLRSAQNGLLCRSPRSTREANPVAWGCSPGRELADLPWPRPLSEPACAPASVALLGADQRTGGTARR